MMSKQTAVEWLIEQYNSSYTLEISDIEKAKAMEKEQIESAYTKGREQWQKYEMESSQLDDVKIPTPRNYYNETYGNGNNL